MEKSVTMNLRVNPTLKVQAEDILKQLGIPMSTAVDMYLRQITLVGGIPFAVTLPKAPASVNADRMETEEIHAKLQKGLEDAEAGRPWKHSQSGILSWILSRSAGQGCGVCWWTIIRCSM